MESSHRKPNESSNNTNENKKEESVKEEGMGEIEINNIVTIISEYCLIEEKDIKTRKLESIYVF